MLIPGIMWKGGLMEERSVLLELPGGCARVRTNFGPSEPPHHAAQSTMDPRERSCSPDDENHSLGALEAIVSDHSIVSRAISVKIHSTKMNEKN